MEKDNVTKEDMLNDLINYINEQTRPPESEGWYSAKDIIDSGSCEDVNYKAIYYRLERGVERGLLEKTVCNNICYYRKIS